MQRRQQKAGRNPHGLLHIVVPDLLAIRIEEILLREYDNQRRSDFQKLLMPIGAKGLQRPQPLVGKAALVILALLPFGSLANLALQTGARHHHKSPWPLVRARGSRPGGGNRQIQHLHGNRVRREVAYTAASG